MASDWSFAAVWSAIAAAAPDREAIVCGTQRRTWSDFDDRASRLASHFWAEGLRPGDKVAIDLLNRPEYLETFAAALLLGCVPVNVNYRYGPTETGDVIDDSDAKIVIHEPDLASTVKKGIAKIGKKWRPSMLARGADYEAADRRGITRRSVARPPARRRRPRLLVHGRDHRHAEGRDVAERRPLRRAVGDGASRHRTD